MTHALAVPVVDVAHLEKRETWSASKKRGRARKKELEERRAAWTHEFGLAVASNPNAPRYTAEAFVATTTAAYAIAFALPLRESVDEVSPVLAANRTLEALWLTPWAPLLMIDTLFGAVSFLAGRPSPFMSALLAIYRRAYDRAGTKTRWGLNVGEVAALGAMLGLVPIATVEGLLAVAEALKGVGEIVPF